MNLENLISQAREQVALAQEQAEKRRPFQTRLHLENAIHWIDKIVAEIQARKEEDGWDHNHPAATEKTGHDFSGPDDYDNGGKNDNHMEYRD